MSAHLEPWQGSILQSIYGDRPGKLVLFTLPKGVSLSHVLRGLHQ
ncbi:hypothetical protein [Paenirhodobacter populi]|nr:hypothetical protein [Sinirhodobacter populi]